MILIGSNTPDGWARRPTHPHTIDSLRELVRLYESWDKPDEAEKSRAKLLPKEVVEQ